MSLDERVSTDKVEAWLERKPSGVTVKAKYIRSGVVTEIAQITVIDAKGHGRLVPVDESIGNIILGKIKRDNKYSSAFVLTEEELRGEERRVRFDADSIPHILGESEEAYTSTGRKFLFHLDRLQEFQQTGRTNPISTHISPEGRCNLKCAYCSVSSRETFNRIDLDVIKSYISTLKRRGLKAVILSGGGESVLYPHFNDLVRFIIGNDLKVALITNGTQFDRVEKDVLSAFSWVRVSINVFPGWEEKIKVPEFGLKTVLGFSYVYSTHEKSDTFVRIKAMADKYNPSYIRLLPNCLLGQEELLLEHRALSIRLEELDDPRFFHQLKLHEPPAPHIQHCSMGFFRPYLSEEKNAHGYPGTVFSCDSVVLNSEALQFDSKYAICAAHEIEDYLDGKITPNFFPHKDCSGCVFSKHVKFLDSVQHVPDHSEFI